MLTLCYSNFSFYLIFESFERLSESIAAVNIFYEEPSYWEIDEIGKKEWYIIFITNIYTYMEILGLFFSHFDRTQLIADLGGILGLCIGASLLSFIELIEPWLNICIIIFSRKFRQNKSKIGIKTKPNCTITTAETFEEENG